MRPTFRLYFKITQLQAPALRSYRILRTIVNPTDPSNVRCSVIFTPVSLLPVSPASATARNNNFINARPLYPSSNRVNNDFIHPLPIDNPSSYQLLHTIFQNPFRPLNSDHACAPNELDVICAINECRIDGGRLVGCSQANAILAGFDLVETGK
jgi:hypothetical protein